MKNLSLFFALFLSLSGYALAQSRVSADEIIKKINNGEDVRYENVKIKGVLDFTNLNNREVTDQENNWFGYDSKTYESQVEVAVEFVECIFVDDVLAYYNDEDDDTYIAHFEDDVIFRQCSFERDSEFKYSEFPEMADFSKSVFTRSANFKYAEFEEGPNFADCIFQREANFKYAEYDDMPNYKAVVFEDDANFKYADFPEGVNFESAIFNELANFKYSKFSEPLNLNGVVFNGDEDFKYTKVEGKDFTTYLIQNR